MQRVERNREGDDEPVIDIAEVGLELEQVPVADCSEHTLVPADLSVRALEHEVERQQGQQVEPVGPDLTDTAQKRDDPADPLRLR